MKKVIKNLIVRVDFSSNRKTGHVEIGKSGQRRDLRQTTHFLVQMPEIQSNSRPDSMTANRYIHTV